MPQELSEAQMEQVRGALYEGNKIAAIKHYREATGEGLRESKDFVEALEPQLRSVAPERFKSSSSTTTGSGAGCLVLLAVLMLGVGAAVFVWLM